MPHDQREMRFVSPVDLTIEAAASEDKPALVRVDAYSGGLMTVAGFGPVVLDVEGIESPDRIPLLADHENRIEAVLGSGAPARRDGRLSVEGTLSRSSERALRVIDLHREGVPLQASVGAEPLETERIAKGKQVVVNGRTIRAESSSFLLVRRSRLKHVAIVANGADGDTSVNIAAKAAPSKEKTDMEFTQWIEAQGFVTDDLDDKQTASLQAMYDASQKPSGKGAATSAVAELRAELAAETARVGTIRKLCAGRHPIIEAKAIGDGWDATRTELEVMREERPRAPAIHASSDNGLVAGEVIEAALCGTLNTPGREKHYSEETLEAADKKYRRLGLQELIVMAAQANGYVGRATISRETLPEIFRSAFSPLNAAFTREKIIDDDLGAFEDLRVRLGAGAARKFNNTFWARYLDNSTFFTEARGNFIKGASTALDINGTGLQAGILAFRKLKSPDGKRVGGTPVILLVPPELQFTAQRLYQSTTVNTGGASSNDSIPSDNIHAGKYRPVVVDWLSDAAFTGQSAKAWYLLRSPSILAPVVVSFLDGVQTPTVDMAEADFNTLGVQFRGYHDFGVDFAEWLAGIKAKGET
jgi:hypothetical protein